MQDIMINRKLCGNFEFSCMFAKTSYLITLHFFVCFIFWEISRKRKQKRKSRIFAVFAWKRPFLSQIKYWFSAFYMYVGQIAPHPPRFWHSQGRSALFRNFLFFLFFIFVKYYDFINSAFLPNFEHFWEHHIYFSFCIKFHSIYFCLFLCVR